MPTRRCLITLTLIAASTAWAAPVTSAQAASPSPSASSAPPSGARRGGASQHGRVARDSGPAASHVEDRTSVLKAGEVKVLQVRGAVDVRLTPGPASIEIQAPMASLAAVETTLVAGTLVITNRGTDDKGAGVVVLLQLPTIVDVSAGDASRVTLKVPDCVAAACPRLALTVTGAARVRAEGRVQQLFIDARGAGQVRLGALSAISGEVVVAGAAGVRLGDLKTLTIKGSGVGRVRYRGNPVVESNVAPSVRVERSRP